MGEKSRTNSERKNYYDSPINMEFVTMPKNAKTSLKKEPVPIEVKISGNPWDTSGEAPATLPLPNDVIITKVTGNYTERDRKLWSFLIAAVWDDLLTARTHEIKISKINAVFEAMGGEKTASWIWDSVNHLIESRAYWESGPDGKRLQGVACLLGGAVTDKDARASGILRFDIPPLLCEIIRKPCRFSRLRIHFMLGLSGKYAVTLYMLLESVANLQTPILDVELSQLRQWLKVPDEKLEKWYDIKRFAIKPALKQINNNPQSAGFTVTMEEIKEGRSVAQVRFIVSKTSRRMADEDALQPENKTQYLPLPLHRSGGASGPPLPTSAYEQASKVAQKWDIYALEQQWREWLVKKKDPDYSPASFVAFCRKKAARQSP